MTRTALALAALAVCGCSFDAAYNDCVERHACVGDGGAAGGLATGGGSGTGGGSATAGGGATGGGAPTGGGTGGGTPVCASGTSRGCGGCDGGVQVCDAGSWDVCLGAPVEVCDPGGIDEDCDGLINAWPPLPLSPTGPTGQFPGAARLPSGDVVAIFMTGPSVNTRVIHSDDSMSPAGRPTSAQASQSYPAISNDGMSVVATWFESRVDGGFNVMVGPLSPIDGRSTLPDAGAVIATTVPSLTMGDELSVAVDSAASGLMVAMSRSGQLTTWRYVLPLTPSSTAVASPAVSGRRPRLEPAGGGLFWLSYDQGSQVFRCLTDGGAPDCPASGTATGSNASVVPVPGTTAAGISYLISPLDAGANDVLVSACMATSCALTTPLHLPLDAGRSDLAASGGDAGTLLAWVELAADGGKWVRTSLSDGGSLTAQFAGVHPQPLPGAGTDVVVYDTNNVTNAPPADQGLVFSKRMCR